MESKFNAFQGKSRLYMARKGMTRQGLDCWKINF
jgi:hypothetical protein